MKKLLYLFAILSLLMPSGLVWLPGTAAPLLAPAENILYVEPGGSGDCTTWTQACALQTALASASTGDEIWAAAGTYTPGAGRNDTFVLISDVGLYGGFAGTETSRDQRDWVANPTVLSGEIGDPGSTADNSYHVVSAIEVDAATVLDGFTISGGNADTSPTPIEWGGGMYIFDSGLTIRNVTFSRNAARGGAGMFINNGEPVLEQVVFVDNAASVNGGGLHTYNSAAPTLTNVSFSGNTAVYDGGGVYNLNSSPTLTDVTINNNTADSNDDLDGRGGGMYNDSSSPNLFNVTFSGNSANDGGGIYNISSSPNLSNVTFSGNSAENGGGGIFNSGGWPALSNVTFSGNTAASGGGIYNPNPDGLMTLTNAILWGNTPDQIYDAVPARLPSYSDIQGGYPGTGNINADPLFVDPASSNLRLKPSSPAIDAGDNAAVPAGVTTDLDDSPRFVDLPTVSDTGSGDPPLVDMGAYEAQLGADILYVDHTAPGPIHDGSSWAQAFTGPQPALAAASSGIEIWVAAGVYLPNPAIREATFSLKDGVGLYGGFAGTETSRDQRDWETNPTVLSGEIGDPGSNADNSYHVVSATGVEAGTVLDGFTISGGNADGSNFLCDRGGGIFSDSSSPTLTNVTISGNSADYLGGGMHSVSGSPTLLNVTFSGNTAERAGGLWIYGGNPTLTNVTFSGNTVQWTGGGMYNIEGWPTLTNVTFSSNSAEWSGGGMVNSRGNPTLTNVTFSGNTAGYYAGAMYNEAGSPTLTNVTFSGNTADYGGGLYNLDGSPTLTNVTFSGNTAAISGSGLYNNDGSPTLANAILWGNTPDSILNEGTSTLTATYSDIQGTSVYPGTGNINADPLFVDPASSNLRLKPSSPAIDAGDNAAVPDGVTSDLDGSPRFVDLPFVADTGHGDPPLGDMGAYEAQRTDFPNYLPLMGKSAANTR